MTFASGGVAVANWGAARPMVLLPFSVFFVFLLLPASILPLLCFIFDVLLMMARGGDVADYRR